jgi:nanoRNase/pAp phosphatase (c-di-AMP/oligoRNAs hydrolase)
MNGEIDKTNQIVALIKEAGNIVIMPSKVAGMDAFAASAGLYHMLKDENKNVTIIYNGLPPEDYGSVDGLDIASNSGQRELVISVDYSGTDASKVNYSTENDILRFTVSPVNRDFELSRIKSEVRGSEYDLIITMGAQASGDLGRAFDDVGGEFGKADVLNVDNTDKNQRFGSINVVDPSVESLSLLILNLGLRWGFRVNQKAAEALLKGISKRKGI